MSKRIRVFILVVSLTIAAGCESTGNGNINVNVIRINVNSNTAVVINSNTNVNIATNANKELTRADFDRDKAKYEAEAKEEKSTIGTGANDLWIWTKTRAALLATDDLRESIVNVDVSNAVVTLRGTVETASQKASAEKVAKGIEGVTSVKNELKVDAGGSVQMTLLPALCIDRRECPKAEFVGQNSKGCPCYKCNKGRPNEETLCFKN